MTSTATHLVLVYAGVQVVARPVEVQRQALFLRQGAHLRVHMPCFRHSLGVQRQVVLHWQDVHGHDPTTVPIETLPHIFLLTQQRRAIA